MFLGLVIQDKSVVGYVNYSDEPEVLPDGQIACTQEQYDNWQNYTIKNGKIVEKDKATLEAERVTRISIGAQLQITDLLSAATLIIAPLQDAIDLGIATDEEQTQYKAWKKYRVLLSRIHQQPGFPENINWPEKPE